MNFYSELNHKFTQQRYKSYTVQAMGCIVAMCACVNARISLDCVTSIHALCYSAYANMRIMRGYTCKRIYADVFALVTIIMLNRHFVASPSTEIHGENDVQKPWIIGRMRER